MAFRLLFAAAFVVAFAAPAAAQVRDPFVPRISEQPTTGAADTTGAPDTAGARDTTATADDGRGETAPAASDRREPVPGGLPATGGGVETSLAIAYVLLASGGAVLVFARVSRRRG